MARYEIRVKRGGIRILRVRLGRKNQVRGMWTAEYTSPTEGAEKVTAIGKEVAARRNALRGVQASTG